MHHVTEFQPLEKYGMLMRGLKLFSNVQRIEIHVQMQRTTRTESQQIQTFCMIEFLFNHTD